MSEFSDLAEVFAKFPGVQIENVIDSEIEGCILFKCSNELSLAFITHDLGSTPAKDGIHLEQWQCSVGCDGDYTTVYYVVSGPEDQEIREEDSQKLIESYTKDFTQHYNGMRDQVENYNGLGVPDLSFVTIAQINEELEKRCIDHVFVWKEERTGIINSHSTTTESERIYKLWKKVKKHLNKSF